MTHLKLSTCLVLVGWLAYGQVPPKPSGVPYAETVTVIQGTNLAPINAQTIIKGWITDGVADGVDQATTTTTNIAEFVVGESNRVVTALIEGHITNTAIHLTPEQAAKIDLAITSAPPSSVVSVNGQTGVVSLTASDVGALSKDGGFIRGVGKAIDFHDDDNELVVRSSGITGSDAATGSIFELSASGLEFEDFQGKLALYTGGRIGYNGSSFYLPSLVVGNYTLATTKDLEGYAQLTDLQGYAQVTALHNYLPLSGGLMGDSAKITFRTTSPEDTSEAALSDGGLRIAHTYKGQETYYQSGNTYYTYDGVMNLWRYPTPVEDAKLFIYASTEDVTQHASSTNNPHNVTAEQIGALRKEEVLQTMLLYHYGDINIEVSPTNWFNVVDGEITSIRWEYLDPSLLPTALVIPWEINGEPIVSIAEDAFSGVTSTTLIAPRTITALPPYAMVGNEYLTSVSFPALKTIDRFTFSGCTALKHLYVPEVTSIAGNGLTDSTQIEELFLPKCTNIAFEACSSMTALQTVFIPEVTEIGDSAFFGCHYLATVVAPKVKVLESGAFVSCWSLTNLVLSADAPVVGTYVFFDSPNVVVTVDNPTAKGYNSTLGGMPVVFPTLTATSLQTDTITLGGVQRGTWPEGIAPSVVTNIAKSVGDDNYVKKNKGQATDLSLFGYIELPQTQGTNLVLQITTSNEYIIVKEVWK